MKNTLLFRKTLALLFWSFAILVLLFPGKGYGQSLYEDFNYTSPLNIGGATSSATGGPVNNWYTHSNGFATTIAVTAGSLNYTGLQASTGSKVRLPGTNSTVSRDVNRVANIAASNNTTYYSFLLNVADFTQLAATFGTGGNGYFVHLSTTNGTGAANFTAKVHIRSSNSAANFRLGISETSNTPVEATGDLSFATTYLVVVKYVYNNTAGNDLATIWVNPTSLGGAEPTGGVNGAGSANVASYNSANTGICLRNASATPKADIDEIRVGTTWASVTPASATAPTITYSPLSKTYGDAQGFSMTATSTNNAGGAPAITYSGGDPAVATITSAGVVTIVGQGTSTFTASQAAGNGFLAGSNSTTGILTVSKAAGLVITANGVSKEYGTALSSPVPLSSAFGASGLKYFDNLGTSPSVTITYGAGAAANATATPGLYSGTAVPSALVLGTIPTYNANNYNAPSYIGGNITVSKKALTITAQNQSVPFGTAVSVVTGAGSFQGSGYLSPETDAVLGGSVSYTTNYTDTTPEGTSDITITPDVSLLTSNNYTFTPVNGTITVTAAGAPSCASSTAINNMEDQSICNGAAATMLTATITSSVGDDTNRVLAYQWYYNTANSNNPNGATEVGTNNNQFTPDNTAVGTTRYYFCVGYATNSECGPQSKLTQALASATVKVTVKAIPSTPTISVTDSSGTNPNDGIICTGATATLTASAGDSYLWSPNNQTTSSIGATTQGNYSVQVTVNGCQSASSSNTFVTVNALPGKPTITGTAAVCFGTTATLTSSSGTSYSWSNGATTQSASNLGAGSYTVQVKDGNGCQSVASDATTVTVGSALAVGAVSGITSGTFGSNLVISEVYGGGGNSGSNYKNDFIELFNPTANAVSLNGKAVQYTSANGNGTWVVTNLSGSIAAGGYYLVQEAVGTGGAINLPTPDAIGTIAMGAGGGKVALTTNTTALTGAISTGTGPTIIDFVGYASSGTNSGFEGAGSTAAPSAINSVSRVSVCVDTNQNGNDFIANLPNPKNSSEPIALCASTLYTETICENTSPTAMTVTTASGSTSPYTYVWYSIAGDVTPSGDTTGWSAAAGATTNGGLTFTPSAITASTTYACFITPTNCAGAWASNFRKVTVNAAPSASIATTVSAVCTGSGTNVTITGTANANVIYKINGGSDITVNLGGSGSVVLATGNLTSDATYTLVKVTNTTTNCFKNLTAQTTVTVNPLPAQPSITPPGPISFYAGDSATLTSSTGSAYSWSTTEATQSIEVTEAGSYTVQVTDSNGCQSVPSVATVVTISPLATFTGIVQGEPLCPGTGDTEFGILGLEAANADYTIYYKIGAGAETSQTFTTNGFANGSIFIALIGSDNGASLTVTGIEYTGEPASKYDVPAVNDVSVITLIVYTDSVAPTNILGTTTICDGGETELTVNGGSLGNGATVEWFADSCGSAVIGTGNSITVSPETDTTYYVRYSGTCGSTTCAQVTVTVQAAPASAGNNGTLSICSSTTLTAGLLYGALTGSPATGGTWSPTPSTANGSITYTYTQAATSPCAVDNTATVAVTVTNNITWYRDADEDSYGNPLVSQSNCQDPSTPGVLWVLNNTDCNDANVAVNPGATEICFNNIDDDCDGDKLNGVCTPVVVNLTNAFPNNMVLSSISTTIISTIPVVPNPLGGNYPITGYIFEITKVGGAPTDVVELPTVVNKFNLTQTNIFAYDTFYDIRVRAIVNGEEQAYQGSVRRLKTPALASPVLLTSQCNVNLPSIGTVIFSQSVLSATDYEFTLTSSAFTMPATQVIVKQVNKFSLSMMQNYVPAYATDYYVTVRVKVGGAWSTGTTTACRITTPAVPTTQLVASQCAVGGSLLPSISSTLTANTIQYATQYTFKVAKAETPGTFVEKTVTGNPLLQLNTLTGLPIEYDTTYRVWVKAVTATTSGSYPLNGCDVTTPATPSSSVVAGSGVVGNCEDGFTVASNATVITSTTYPGAKYHFIIKGYNGNVLIYNQFVDRSTNNNVSLSMFPAIPYNVGYTYYISVALKFASGLVQPKEECLLILPAPPAREVVAEDTSNVKVNFSATAYPNPFANNFMIDVKTRNESAVSLKVYDMIGRLVEQRSVSVSNLETTPIGDNYPSGVYNVIVTQGENVKTVRVVKR